MEIAGIDLGPKDGLNRRRSIDEKIVIDLKNKTIIVEGTDYTYSPTGVVISQLPFRYERDNIPDTKEVKDDKGNIITPFAKGNPRFDNYYASPIGKGISDMIQGTLNGD